MADDTKPHNIFLTNPLELFGFVDRFVRITLENREVITGTVYTIDPVSQSVVLVNKEKSGELSLKIVLRHSVTSMEALHDIPEDQHTVISSNLFDSEASLSSNKNMKEDVKSWLLQNMIPVVESGDRLIIDSLEIYPPYGVDQCCCNNSIVLSRIQTLLRQMPSKSS